MNYVRSSIPYTQRDQVGQAAAAPANTTVAVWFVLGLAGIGLAAYHGYHRNNESVGAAVGWGVLGGLFPFLTVPIALAQGFGERA